jgi:hypothetical protein
MKKLLTVGYKKGQYSAHIESIKKYRVIAYKGAVVVRMLEYDNLQEAKIAARIFAYAQGVICAK